MIIGIVSGYFNPMHGGHLDYIIAAKAQCERLIVIVNNDKQVKIKGSVPFMDERHRLYIMENLKPVYDAIIATDEDKTVCKTLELLRSRFPKEDLIFFNSGDRQQGNLSLAESQICFELGIKEVVLPLPKRYSSSELLKKLKEI